MANQRSTNSAISFGGTVVVSARVKSSVYLRARRHGLKETDASALSRPAGSSVSSSVGGRRVNPASAPGELAISPPPTGTWPTRYQRGMLVPDMSLCGGEGLAAVTASRSQTSSHPACTAPAPGFALTWPPGAGRRRAPPTGPPCRSCPGRGASCSSAG